MQLSAGKSPPSMMTGRKSLRQMVVRMVELEALSAHAMRKGITDELLQRQSRETDRVPEHAEILLRLWIGVGERADGFPVAVDDDLHRSLESWLCVRVVELLQGQDPGLELMMLVQIIDDRTLWPSFRFLYSRVAVGWQIARP